MICNKCNREMGNQPYCTNVDGGCLNYTTREILFPETGGTFMDIIGFKHPYPGYPECYALGQNATTKRAIISSVKLASKFPTSLIPLVFTSKRKILNNLITWLAEVYEAEYEKYQIHVAGEKGIKLCKSGRELLRVGLKFAKTEREIKAVWCIVMMWEMDGAYRFRGQDILSELNKEKLQDNPRKEIVRLLNLWLERENPELAMRNKVEILVKGIKILLFLSVKSERFFYEILNEINLEEVRPTTADLYWMCRYFDYQFAGLSYDVRNEWKKQEEEGYKPPEVIPEQFANVDVKPNEFFYKLDEYNAKRLAEMVKNTLIQNHKNHVKR